MTAVPNGGYLLGGGRFESGHVGTYITTDQQTTSGLLVIDPQTLEIIETHDVNVAWAQYLQPTANGDAIYIDGGTQGTLRFDPISGTLTEIDTTTPWEAALIEHGLSYTRNAN
ncbi:MAG: hypothetical protein P1T08_18730 [Acidimicrobiia bacterium]|nr:hypothetical protein [Acidimicrobiia bacterium]